MGFSFVVRAASKEEAASLAAIELAKVVEQQPVHATEAKHALAAIISYVSSLATDASKDVVINCNGWLAWATPEDGTPVGSYLIQSACIGITASLQAKAAPDFAISEAERSAIIDHKLMTAMNR